MKSFRFFPVVALIGCLAFSHSSSAAVDPAASVVLLRTSCNDGAGGTLHNCFTTVGDLFDWMLGTRMPTAAAPLTVEIGPGDYGQLSWQCTSGQGHVTFRGAGRGRTIFSNPNNLSSAAVFSKCDALTFESMTITGAFIAVTWGGRGSSTWTDVEMLGRYAAWYETLASNLSGGGVCAVGQGTHKYFSSTFMVTNPIVGGLVFQNHCGKNWFWGSEIVLNAPAATYTGGVQAISSKGAGNEVHVYGSNIRVFSGEASAITSLGAIGSHDGGEVHVHGTGIDVISMTGKNIVALSASNGGEIHADESAYVLKTSAPGTATRINDNGGTGHIHAPYLWQHIPDPATVPGFASVNGADITTEIVGADINMLVYNSQCTGAGGPWYNVALRTCR